MSNWKLYIDDIREPKTEGFTVARTMEEAVDLIHKNGMPSYISFDHDLGIDENGALLPTGYDFAKWIVKADMDGSIIIPENFTFQVHSDNPPGKANIESLMENYLALI